MVAPRGLPAGNPSTLIIPWLACLAVGNTVIRVAVMGEPEVSEGVEAYREWIVTSDRVEAVGTVLMIAAAVLALLMVRTLTAQQERQQPAASAPWQLPGAPWQGAPPAYGRPAAYPDPSAAHPGQPSAYPWGPPPPQQQGQPWPAPPPDQTPPAPPHR